MEAVDLRLYNYIFYKNKIVQVISIDLDLEDEGLPLIKVDTGEFEKNPIGGRSKKYIEDNETQFQLIPLTEDWIVKFGFNYQDAKYWIDGLCIHTTDKDFYILQEQGRVFLKDTIPASV